MNRRLAILVLLSTFALLATASQAGVVYVSLASDRTIEGVRLRTFLDVVNPTDSIRNFETFLIPTFANGTERPKGVELVTSPLYRLASVVPQRTMRFAGFTDGTTTGLLEINGEPPLAFSAWLVSSIAGKVRDEAQIPVVSSDSFVKGGQTIYLQDLPRQGNEITNFGFINLVHEPNQCTVELFSAAGQALVPAVVSTLPALSHHHWDDVFGVIEQTAVADAHARVKCEKSYSAYAFVLDTVTGALRAVGPSGTGASTFLKPGQVPPKPPEPEPGDCPQDAICYDLQGLFYTVTRGQETKAFSIPIAAGEVFKDIRVTLTYTHGQWHRFPDFFHNIFWLYMSNWHETIGYLNVRGPNRNKLLNEHLMGIPKNGEYSRKEEVGNLILVPGQTYTVDYHYDAANGRNTTVLRTASGTQIARMQGVPGTSRVFADGRPFVIWFGLHEEHFEAPTYNAQYRDLRIVFQR